ncbi:MAG: fluoride efflux transporter CrcB [Hyphomicrobiaceae bacterium]
MRLFLLASAGGAIGAGARYLVNAAAVAMMGVSFPWGTFIVNVVGSLLMGIVVAAAEPVFGGSAMWRTFLATGILGGFTTFSAFSLDTYGLIERREIGLAVVYVVASVLISLVVLIVGFTATKAMLK